MPRWLTGLAFLVLVEACASTLPLALPVEVLVVLDKQANELLVMPTDSVGIVHRFSLDATLLSNPTLLAVRGTMVAVGYGSGQSVAIIDLNGPRVIRRFLIGGNDVLRSIVLTGEDEGWAAVTNTNTVVRFHPLSGATDAPLDSGLYRLGGPRGFATARGLTYVINGNRQNCDPGPPGCPTGRASWLTLLDPLHPDSIPLIGPGNASAAANSPDGLFYVLVRGDSGVFDGQLTGVDPVDPARSQFSYAGFGPAPQFLAADGFNHLLIASASGLMVFNTANRSVIQGTPGIPLSHATALATDGLGRIYVVEGGSCTPGGATGRVRIFGNDLIERVGVPAGVCPVAAVVTEIPADQYRLDG
jgi:hypothetical protein